MFDNNSMYFIISIIFIFFILYMLFLLILTIIDKKLTGIKINIPKQDIIIDKGNTNNNIEQKENFTNNDNIEYGKHIKLSDLSYETDKLSNIKGYSQLENNSFYINNKDDPVIDHIDENDVCYDINGFENKKNNYGRTNFPHPSTMNSFDRKIFKSFYQEGMTLQDYINWLYLHGEDGKEMKLPYEHIKYYNEIKKGRKLKYIKGICPPKAKANSYKPNSAEFYQNLYGNEIINQNKINRCFSNNVQARSQFDLSLIDEATNTHSKSIKPFNTCNYTSMNNYEILPEIKCKMSAKNLNTMLTPKISSSV